MAETNKYTLKIIGNYKFAGRTLGKGNFARVELAEHRLTGDKVAIKILDMKTIKEEYVRRNILREGLIMKKVQHDNIVKLYETLKHDYLYCLVTELVKGGDLRNYIQQQKSKKITEGKARNFFRQLLSAVKHLHDNNIVHRDLKMDNILLNETKNSIKIVDFGLSNSFNKGELLKTHCGSPEYAAPELFEKGCLYGPSVDIWSMGVILYAMVIGHLPFSTHHRGAIGRDDLYQNAKKGLTILHEKYLSRISIGCRSLLAKLLQPDPTNRVSLEEITHHTWVTENGRYPLVSQPSFLLPKSIREKVIDRMAKLFSSSTADMETRVETSKHDAVCAVYNLLLDAAIKDCRYKSKTRNPAATSVDSSSPRCLQTSKSNERIRTKKDTDEMKNETEYSVTNRDDVKFSPVVKSRGSTPIVAKASSSKVKSDNSCRKSQVNPSSGVKIIEFTDAIKLEGRAKSPIIRKPSSAKASQKSLPSQKSAALLLTNKFDRKETQNNELIDELEKHTQNFRIKKQLFCNETAPGLAASCKISRFPEEDKSSRRPKVELRPSLVMLSSKQFKIAAGFKAPLSMQKLKFNACACVSSNQALREKEKKNIDTRKKSVNQMDCKVHDSQTKRLRRTSLQGESNHSTRLEKVNRDTHHSTSLRKATSKTSYETMQSRTKRQPFQTSMKNYDGVSLLSTIVNKDEKRLRSQKRFGSAFSELRRRSSYTLRNNSKQVETKRSSSITTPVGCENSQNDALLDNRSTIERRASENEKEHENIVEALREQENYKIQEESKIKRIDYSEEPHVDGSSNTHDLGNRNSFDASASRNIDETTAYRTDSPQLQRYINSLETQRKVSLGILKTSSKTSNTELLTLSAGSEKKNLKVTFKDEVGKNNNGAIDHQSLKKIHMKKFTSQVDQIKIDNYNEIHEFHAIQEGEINKDQKQRKF